MDERVLATFQGRILAVDTLIALKCVSLHLPAPRSERDALIAATARVHGMQVVTRNVLHFEPTGVGVVDPWKT
jgi:toxin FitB